MNAYLEALQDVKGLGGLPLFIVAILVAFVLGEFALSYQLAVGLVLAYALTAVIRALYFRQRPVRQKFQTWWQKIDASSFPSLHSMRASVLATLLALYFNNLLLSVLFIACAVVVASSRVLLKRHFVRDVVAGLLLGIVVAFVSVWLVRFIS